MSLNKRERKYYNNRTEGETLHLQPFLRVYMDAVRSGEKPQSSQGCRQPRTAWGWDNEVRPSYTNYISTNSPSCLGKRHLPNVWPWDIRWVLRTTPPKLCWLGSDAPLFTAPLLSRLNWSRLFNLTRVFMGVQDRMPLELNISVTIYTGHPIKTTAIQPTFMQKWISLSLLKTPKLLICWIDTNLAMHARAFNLVSCPKREKILSKTTQFFPSFQPM